MDPDGAAQWMRETVHEAGFLSQRDAATFLHSFADEGLAYIDYNDSLCVGLPTLRRFRKASVDIVYDRRLKGWRPRQARGEAGRKSRGGSRSTADNRRTAGLELPA